jgi:hypothetical protein
MRNNNKHKSRNAHHPNQQETLPVAVSASVLANFRVAASTTLVLVILVNYL